MKSKPMARTLSFVLLAVAVAVALATRVNGQSTSCTDRGSGKPADCVPATFTSFDIPFDKLPEILVVQRAEIVKMKAWLTGWGLSRP